MESNITHYRDHIGASPQKFYKTTLFRGDFLMLGLNCLEPGQVQPIHDHARYQHRLDLAVKQHHSVQRIAGW